MGMNCYLIARRTDREGCIALRTAHGQALADLKKKLADMVGDDIQLVVISRPEAYGEYEPYRFVETEDEFIKEVCGMNNKNIDPFYSEENIARLERVIADIDAGKVTEHDLIDPDENGKSEHMEYKGFIGSVEFSEADNVFFGSVEGVNALISYEGATVEELEEDFRAAIDDYLALDEK